MARPMEARRLRYMKKFNLRMDSLHRLQKRALTTPSKLDQLDACKDDAARRLLLGISK